MEMAPHGSELENSGDDAIAGPSASNSSAEVPKSKMSARQLGILGVLCFGQFCLAASISLQAPFFPREAEKKGATPTVYGFIFGAFEMAVIVSSPIYGKIMARVSPYFLVNSGLFVVGACSILFGFLDRSPPGSPFIGLAFATRILEGFGCAAATTGSYTIVASEIQNKLATSFSFMETFFGLGLIFGPSVGGLLYEIKGFPLPFHVMGGLLILSASCAWFLVPNTEPQSKKSGEMFKFLSDFGIMLDAFTIITSLMFIGFYATTLEPFLRQFNLTPAIVGLIFIITGSLYGITSPIWGYLCDKGVNCKMMCVGGYILLVIAITIIGPAPFIPVEPHLWLTITALVIGGFGLACKIVCAFIGSLQDATTIRGFPNDITTHGMVSAMFSTSCSIGAFIGPSIGGFLYEKVGFRMASVGYLAIEVIFLVLTLTYYIWRKKSNAKSSRTPLLGNEEKNASYS